MKMPGYILKFVLVLASAACLGSCMSITPVDVVTDGKDLYFILENSERIDFVRVRAVKAARAAKAAWLLGYDASVPVKERKYLELDQLRYGKKYEGFSWVEGPFPLKKNVEYLVEINMSGKFAKEIFMVKDDNTVVMPRPKFERQKTREYEITTDKNGDKVFKKK